MSGGLLALLDDVAAIAKVAAASLDDMAAQAVKAGSKAAGIVIDDTAVTPRYVVGFAADRELPIVWRIAVGSLRNKLLFLLPAALLLTAFAPWAITPLLMLGGAYLCFEGYEKVHEWLSPHDAGAKALGAKDPRDSPAATSSKSLEDERVAGAIRTDMILSAEIMAISLAQIESPSLWMTAATLAFVAILVTVGVYGLVALIVKADDIGLALAQSTRPASRFGDILRRRKSDGAPTPLDKRLAPMAQAVGGLLVRGMPSALAFLGVVGTLAMLWVGGGILLHGLAHYGLGVLETGIHTIAAVLVGWLPGIGGFLTWLISAAIAGVIGLAVGWVAAVAMHRLVPAKA